MTVLVRLDCEACGRICFQRGGRVVIEAAWTRDHRAPSDEFLQDLEGRKRTLSLAAAVAMRFEDLARYGKLEIPRELNELRDGLWEIKAERVRLPFFWMLEPSHARAIRLTHGFLKGTERTPRREIDRAGWIRTEDRAA